MASQPTLFKDDKEVREFAKSCLQARGHFAECDEAALPLIQAALEQFTDDIMSTSVHLKAGRRVVERNKSVRKEDVLTALHYCPQYSLVRECLY